LSFKK